MNSTCCVDMYGPQTILKANPAIMGKEPPERNFAFDYSYWSFDGYKVEADGYFSPEEGSKYADQKKLFDDLGVGILNNAFNGFNCSLFAYGQTGSGSNN